MATGKHSKGKHSRPRGGKSARSRHSSRGSRSPRGSRREFSFPRGPVDPAAPAKVAVPEEIAKTAAGKMQTAEAGHDDAPGGEAATAEVLDDWVAEQRQRSHGEDAETRRITRRGKLAIAAVIVVAALVVAGIAFFANFHPVSTPSQVVQTALEAVKDDDAETLSRVYAGDVTALDSQLRDSLPSGAGLGSEAQVEGKLNDEQKKVLARIQDDLRDFDYTIDSTAENGDAATVTATVTTRDFGTFASNVLGTYIADGLAAASKDDLESDADAATRFVGVVQQHEGELGDKTKSAQMQLTLTRADDGSWRLAELTPENLDALTGGLTSTTSEMARQLQSGGAS